MLTGRLFILLSGRRERPGATGATLNPANSSTTILDFAHTNGSGLWLEELRAWDAGLGEE